MRLAWVLSLGCFAGCAEPVVVPVAGFEGGVQGMRVSQRAIAVDGGAGRLIVVELAPEVAVAVVPATRPGSLQDIAGVSEGCVAINGGFYDAGGAMGWVVHDGEEHAPLQGRGGSGVLVIDAAGLRIVHRDAVRGRPREALQSIDRVVDGGRSLVGAGARPDADARSAVGVRSDGTVVFVVMFAERAVEREAPGRVVLGSASSSSGMSLAAWAELLARPVAQGGIGAVTALNLDGGYSTSMVVRVGEVALDVVAHGATINALRACAG